MSREIIVRYKDGVDHIKIKGGEYVRDYQRGEWILLESRYPIEQKVYWNKEQALADTKGNGAIEKRKCSCCGFTKNFMGHMKDEKFKLWNYCPNCGARMKGADDDRND